MVRFSDFDLMLLLIQNSRQTNVQLAKKLRVTETAIRKRIKKLEEKKLITRYTIETDPKKLGYWLDVFLGIKTHPEGHNAVLTGLKEEKNIIQLHAASGEYNIIARCWFKDSKQLTQYTRNLREKKEILRITPSLIQERLK